MKYPDTNTTSKPVKGAEAIRLVEAVTSDRYLADDAAKATINKIVEREKSVRNGDAK